MDSNQPHLSIIIPAYNEEKRIGDTLLAIDKYLNGKNFTAEVLVVDGLSKDNTAQVVQDYAKTLQRVRLLMYKESHQKGFFVRSGMLEARGALRLFTDADNATPIEELDKLIPYVKQPGSSEPQGEKYDVVIASIGLKESKVERAESGIRALAGKMANLLIQIVVLPGIHDTQRGFKLFTADAAERIFSISKIDRWGFDIEVLALAKRFGYRIKEVPIRWIHNPDSRVGAGAYLNTLMDLARIRLYLWFGAYKKKTLNPKP